MITNLFNPTAPNPDKDDCDRFMDADMGLGMFQQNFSATRGDLTSYAVKQGYAWALRDFLVRRGLLDDDWEQRLIAIGQREGHG